jgi:hypothetical protein
MLCAIASSVAASDEIDFRKGKLEALYHHVGTYNYEAILQHRAVRATLSAQLGQADLAELERNLGTHGPVDFIGGHLVLSGIETHGGLSDHAEVWIDLQTGTTHVALMDNRAVTVFSDATEYDYVPSGLRQTALMWRLPTEALQRPPPSVVWKNAKQ